jgi:hypothetical protein
MKIKNFGLLFGLILIISTIYACTASSPCLRHFLYSITLTPSSSTLTVGQTQSFAATGRDNNGNVVTFNPNWKVFGGIGTINSAGNFVATAVGTGRVVATRGYIYYGCISGEAIITVNPTAGAASALASIVVTPDTQLKVGASQTFTATGCDLQGNPIAIEPTWSVSGGIGTVTQTGVFVATLVGEGAVVANVDAMSGQAVVTVEADGGSTTFTPVLTSIFVSPSNESILVGEYLQFSATGYDQNGNIMTEGFAPLWSANRGEIYSGLFYATAEGAGIVQAAQDSVSGRATINVYNP